MAENSKIEWTDHTFNPWIGCTKVSPGCDHCYAARQDAFRKWTPEGWGGPRQRTSPANWKLPLKWNEQPWPMTPDGKDHRRQRVFCASLADVFDNEVPVEWRVDLFRLIANTPHLDWLLLTKRIGNAAAMIERAVREHWNGAPPRDGAAAWPWPNVWLGATVVNQEEADRDIPKLLAAPARVRFLSIEPMLGPINLVPPMIGWGWLRGVRAIDWVIGGFESGPHARPGHVAWARSLRDQCACAGAAFHWKQNGEWALCEFEQRDAIVDLRGGRYPRDTNPVEADMRLAVANGGVPMRRVGKAAAGRLLDGVEHNGFPT